MFGPFYIQINALQMLQQSRCPLKIGSPQMSEERHSNENENDIKQMQSEEKKIRNIRLVHGSVR